MRQRVWSDLLGRPSKYDEFCCPTLRYRVYYCAEEKPRQEQRTAVFSTSPHGALLQVGLGMLHDDEWQEVALTGGTLRD